MPAVNPSAIHMLFSYRLLLSYHFDEFDKALDHSNLLRQHLDGMISTAYIPLFHFYDALSRLAVYGDVNRKKQRQFLKTMARHLKKLKKWAAFSPTNYQHKWLLVTAEQLRAMGDGTKAAPLYDKAITLAREHGFIQEAALGYELAAKYHLAAGSHRSFERYMTKAVHCYARWGAKTKVACLVKHYPQLLLQEGENNVFAIPAVPDSGSV